MSAVFYRQSVHGIPIDPESMHTYVRKKLEYNCYVALCVLQKSSYQMTFAVCVAWSINPEH